MSKTKSTKKYRLNPWASVALVLCALSAVYCGTTAWLTSGTPLNPLRLASLEDFAYTIYVSTDGGSSWTTQSDVLTFTKSDIGNLSKLCIKIKQEGSGVAFTRVRISQEWVKTDGTRLQGAYNLPFTVADDVCDNRSVDGYVYYEGAFPANGEAVIFDGFNSDDFDTSVITDDVTLRIDVTVDAVQFNRYQQFWGIDTLPWR